MGEIRTKVALQSLLRDIVTLTGASEADAALVALQERLARLKGPVSREERVTQALTTLRSAARFVDSPGQMPSGRERDRALGYGEEGI